MNSIIKKISTISAIVLISGSVTACLELAIATVATTTIDVISDRRTTGAYFDDNSIEIEMRKLLHGSKRVRKQTHINPVSYNGILLLTGEVTSKEMKQEVTSNANMILGVRQVIDETRISGKTGLLSRTNDSVLTGKVKSMLLLKMAKASNQIKVVSEHGNVYLMGIVTDEEANKATEITRSIGGVVRVIRAFEIKMTQYQ